MYFWTVTTDVSSVKAVYMLIQVVWYIISMVPQATDLSIINIDTNEFKLICFIRYVYRLTESHLWYIQSKSYSYH